MKYKTTGYKHSQLPTDVLQDRKYTCKRNIEVRFRNHRYRGKAFSAAHSVCL